ncbi:MAG: hypothetical protein FJX71_01340 [Alphaproteobacteria bacterium]|nr:hypothetical protein [Alphaproteobacteria bacterium]
MNSLTDSKFCARLHMRQFVAHLSLAFPEFFSFGYSKDCTKRISTSFDLPLASFRQKYILGGLHVRAT